MSLMLVLLLMIAALTVAIRILDSRRTAGLVVLGLVAFALLGPATNRLAHLASCGGLPVAHAASEDDEPAAAESADVVQADPGGPETSEITGESEVAKSGRAASDDVPVSREETLTIDVDSGNGGVVIPPRPTWVESDDVRTGKFHTTAVSSGPHETERECHASLDRELQRAVAEYVDWYLGNGFAERFKASTFIHYRLDEIKRRLLPADRTYHEVIKVSFGPMHQMHAQLQFDEAFRRELDGRRAELDRHWREWIVSGRLLGSGLTFALVLTLMGVFVGYFRADTATRGFYTGRLQFIAAVVILAVLTAGALLARQILFM